MWPDEPPQMRIEGSYFGAWRGSSTVVADEGKVRG